MNLKEEYMNTFDKINYLNNLATEDKRQLYNMLSSSEQSSLVENLPLENLKKLIEAFSKQERYQVYKRLSDTRLKELYRNSTEEEKQEIIEVLEARQMTLNDRLETFQTNINDSISRQEAAERSIANSNNNISIATMNINEKKQELKNNKVILKKLDKERKRQIKKVMCAQKRLASPLNKISIISKYRTRKYSERVASLQQTYQAIDAQKMSNEQLNQEINKLNNKIEQEKKNIEKQEQKIKQEQQNIKKNISRISKTEIQIKKVSKTEKRLLGRKLYNQTVFKRDCIIVRNKKKQQVHRTPSIHNNQTVINNQSTQPNQTVVANNVNQNQKTETITASQVEVIPSRTNYQQNTEMVVNNMINAVSRLQSMNVNFYSPSNRFNNVLTEELLARRIIEVQRTYALVCMLAMAGITHEILRQQMMMVQAQMAAQQANEYSGNLSHNRRGSVNLTLLASIILFVLSIIIFLIR